VAEAAAVLALVALGAGVVALVAVLDGRRLGIPASLAVLAPLAETARLLRSRPTGTRRRLLGGAVLVAASVLRVLALPVADTAVLGAPLGIGWFVVADLVLWTGGALLAGRAAPRLLLRAAAVEAPLLLALAAAVAASQGDERLAVEAPVAFLTLLVGGGILLPRVVAPNSVGTGADRLLVAAGRAMQPVSVSAVAAVLFLEAGGSPGGALLLLGATVVLTGLLVVLARRVPVPRPALVARLSLRVLLPLAAVQLAVVVALTVLAGT
jgi:NADH-quinone oxidoreductase subunit H